MSDNTDPEFVLVEKSAFEQMVSDTAERMERTHKIEWGQPFDFNEFDGVVYTPTVTIEYPDEPAEEPRTTTAG